MKHCQFCYGWYQYNYQLICGNRRTLSLTVHPDMSIVLKAPLDASNQRIETFLKDKWLWLEKQLRFFQKYQRKSYPNEFLSGESFFYLGRQYKLKVIRSRRVFVKLSKGTILVSSLESANQGYLNRVILKRWYQKQSIVVLQKRYNEVLKNFNYDYVPSLVICKMSKRWGSYVNKKKIIINPELIKTSTDCIDYVITHELCHIKYKNHTKDFYLYLESKFPNWKKAKEKLELKWG